MEVVVEEEKNGVMMAVEEEEEGTGSDSMAAVFSGRMVGGGGGSIAQRRAAKFGFNAAGISTTALFRSDSLLSSPTTARSPRLTIPPGISPTALLDSPVMLHNSQAQPSPTTGTLPLSPLNRGSSILHLVDSIGERNTCSDVGSSFMFMPHCVQASTTNFQFLPETNKESIPSHHPTTDFPFLPEIHKETNITPNIEDINFSLKDSTYITNGNFTTPEILNSNMSRSLATQQQQQKNNVYREDLASDTMGVYQRDGYLLVDHTRASDDGFNWRKYGQKHVKGSEFPRSYYKCTHPNCQVKKKVERSRNGEITEITYKGSHGHPKPRLSRPMVGSDLSLNEMIDVTENSGGGEAKSDGWTCFGRIQPGSREVIYGSDGKVEGLELTSSNSAVTDLSDPATQIKAVGLLESVETPEFSSTLATSHDEDGDCGDDEDRFTQCSISLADEADEDELESKRRRTESSLMEASLATRAIREPRVVVQIESDIDILDDGYRWRKYGQKVVKGNPNPRSYYKCTSAGCSVRKHVERASHDLKCVITTYEGKHNHEVPVAKSGGGGGGVGQAGQLGPGPPRTGIPYPHHHLLPQFGRGPEFGELMRAGLLESLRTPPAYQVAMQSRIGYPPLPEMFPPFPLPLPLPLPLPPLFNFSSPAPLPGPTADLYMSKMEHDISDPALPILEPVAMPPPRPPPPLIRRFA